ncbi:MAG: hypothetical protein AB1649_12935 [Chloroflexota bacterium]
MASKINHIRLQPGLNTVALLAVLASILVNPPPVFADGTPVAALPDLASFTLSVLNGQSNELRGVYVRNVMAMPVVQQPVVDAGYVASIDNVITEFRMAAEVGNVGLLAHNTLGGAKFFELLAGQEVTLIYGDGRMEVFVIREVVKFQALDPYSPYSEFRNLESGVTISASKLFEQVYRGERHLTLQTCIEAEGNASWGRMFIMAEPKLFDIAELHYSYTNHIR